MDTKRLTVKYVVIGLEVSVSYWQGETLVFDAWQGGTARRVKESQITWDPANTTVLGARLHGIINAGASTKGTILFNGVATQFCDATLWDATVDTEVEVSLRNGKNSCEIRLDRPLPTWFIRSGTFYANLVIEYTGDSPYIGPLEEVTPPGPEDYTWLIYAGLGIAGLIAVGYVLSALRPPMIIQV